jgi:hypothetical protein
MTARAPGSPPAASEPNGYAVRDLDAFECAMIEFLLSWAPYGDPPEEDCLPLFGKTLPALKAEIRTLVATPRCCSASDRTLLMRVARVLGPAAAGHREQEGLHP